MATYRVEPRERSQAARVSFRDGCYTFVVMGSDGHLAGRGGADRELPDHARLIAASKDLIDWTVHPNIDVLRELRKLELDQYDAEVRSIVDRAAFA